MSTSFRLQTIASSSLLSAVHPGLTPPFASLLKSPGTTYQAPWRQYTLHQRI
ncbi:hypothetical protein BJY04DRAFT_178542 [Aspergillus karnatakaensis]|uniref:uncharacterized protein n=1 Tax=Aspergillus karnatakaensis TaxID=1810916 RepID=UPI003CCCB9A9